MLGAVLAAAGAELREHRPLLGCHVLRLDLGRCRRAGAGGDARGVRADRDLGAVDAIPDDNVTRWTGFSQSLP